MTVDLVAFGKRYRTYLRLLESLNRFLPKAIVRCLRVPFRWINPYNLSKPLYLEGLRSAHTDVPLVKCWNFWLDNHFRFVNNFLNYRQLDELWLSETVQIENNANLSRLRSSGGLVLTFHNHHQNTLCCALGLSGCVVSAVAARPQDSPLFPLIGKWATRVNTDSSRLFRGGSYVFTGNKRELLKGIKQSFESNQALVCLIDFNDHSNNSTSYPFIGKSIRPPTGVIEHAIRYKIPIFFASLTPTGDRFLLSIKSIEANGGIEGVVQQYLSMLTLEVTEHPATWQGWDWFSTQEEALSAKAE